MATRQLIGGLSESTGSSGQRRRARGGSAVVHRGSVGGGQIYGVVAQERRRGLQATPGKSSSLRVLVSHDLLP